MSWCPCTDVSCLAYNSLAFLRLSPTGNPLPTPSDFDGAMSGGHRVTRVTYEGSCPTGGAIDSVRLVHMQMSAPLATHLLTPHVTSHHSLGASVASNGGRGIRCLRSARSSATGRMTQQAGVGGRKESLMERLPADTPTKIRWPFCKRCGDTTSRLLSVC